MITTENVSSVLKFDTRQEGNWDGGVKSREFHKNKFYLVLYCICLEIGNVKWEIGIFQVRYAIKKAGRANAEQPEELEEEVSSNVVISSGRLDYTGEENEILRKECGDLLRAPKYSKKQIEPYFSANEVLKPFILKFGIHRLQTKIKMKRTKYRQICYNGDYS